MFPIFSVFAFLFFWVPGVPGGGAAAIALGGLIHRLEHSVCFRLVVNKVHIRDADGECCGGVHCVSADPRVGGGWI